MRGSIILEIPIIKWTFQQDPQRDGMKIILTQKVEFLHNLDDFVTIEVIDSDEERNIPNKTCKLEELNSTRGSWEPFG